jgi:hypothetical protein
VPTDATIVVMSSNGTDTRATLVDAAGVPVPLELVRTLEASPGCSTGLEDVLFFRPATPLVPSSEYTLDVGFVPEAVQPRNAQVRFTTGTARRLATAAPTLKHWLFAQDLGDSRFLQLFASADGPEPSFIVAKGNPATIVLSLGPLAFKSPASIPLAAVDCAEFEHVDVDGKTVMQGRLCEPEKCRRDTSYLCGTCGDNCGGSSWEIWQTAPSCGAKVTTADAGADGPASNNAPERASGCNLTGTGSSPLAIWVMAALLLGLRRQKSRRCG